MPLKLSSYWDRVLAEREAVEFWHQKRNGLLKQYFATVQSGDMKEREKVRNAIVNYNDTLPKDARGQAISSDTLSRSMRMRARAQASQETGTPMQRGDVPLVRGIQRLFPESVVDVREVK